MCFILFSFVVGVTLTQALGHSFFFFDCFLAAFSAIQHFNQQRVHSLKFEIMRCVLSSVLSQFCRRCYPYAGVMAFLFFSLTVFLPHFLQYVYFFSGFCFIIFRRFFYITSFSHVIETTSSTLPHFVRSIIFFSSFSAVWNPKSLPLIGVVKWRAPTVQIFPSGSRVRTVPKFPT